MKKSHAFLMLCFILGIGFFAVNQLNRAKVYYNGHILTMDAENSVVEAVFVLDGSVAKTGSTAEVLALAQEYRLARTFDLEGKTMMPGIIDAHGHFPGDGLSSVLRNLNSPPIGPVTTHQIALDLLKDDVKAAKAGEWIFAYGYDDTLLAEPRHFTMAELNAVSNEHPIFIMHISGHMGVANSLGLEKMGIEESSVDPEGGVYARDEQGKLNGLLLEIAAKPFLDRMFNSDRSTQIKILRAGQRNYLKQGVTTAQNGLLPESLFLPLAAASRLGLLDLRVVVFPDELFAKRIVDDEVSTSFWQTNDFFLGPVKLVADGSIQGYTGFLSEPYTQVPPFESEDYQGFPIHSQDKLDALVKEFHEAGMQIAIHGNGDAAIDMIISSVEKVQAASFKEDPRFILIHGQMARRDQLKRMKQLGITPSFFTAHVFYWGDRHEQLFMGDRARNISPMKSALNRGLLPTHHLDSPVVPMQPFFSAWVSVERQTRTGKVLGPDERISIIESLRSMTIDAARQVFLDSSLGSIEVGKLADLIILSDNPLGSSEALKAVRVLETIVGGDSKFQRH